MQSRILTLPLLVALTLLLPTAGGGESGAPELVDLEALAVLGETFDSAAGSPRLVLLLSPT